MHNCARSDTIYIEDRNNFIEIMAIGLVFIDYFLVIDFIYLRPKTSYQRRSAQKAIT